MKTQTNRGVTLFLLVVFIVPVLAGCLGDDKAEPETGGDDSTGGGVDVVDPDQETEEEDEVIEGGSNPKAHVHHYWKDRTEVIVYDGDVEFQNLNTKYSAYNSLIWAEFDLEDDEDDIKVADGGSADMDAEAVTPNGKADVIFAGTGKIAVTFPEQLPAGVDHFLFFYKSANTPEYRPEAGAKVTAGQTYEIELNEVGMADPAHQTAVSRWKFRLIGRGPTNAVCDLIDQQSCIPGMGNPSQGEQITMHLRMNAVKGSDEQLDPPHPDFWGKATTRTYEPITDEITSPTFQTPVVREKHAQLTDLRFQAGSMVPMGTERVEFEVSWSADIPVPDGFFLKFQYHGANSAEYVDADEVRGDCTQKCTYVVYNYKGEDLLGLEDSPYVANSDWRFRLVPSMVDPTGDSDAIENLGVFQGTYEIAATAYKKEGFVLV